MSIKHSSRFFPVSEAYGLSPVQHAWLNTWAGFRDIQTHRDRRPIQSCVVGLMPTLLGPVQIEPGVLLKRHQFELVTLSAFPTSELRGYDGRAKYVFPVAVQEIDESGQAGSPTVWRDLGQPPKAPEPRMQIEKAKSGETFDLLAPQVGMSLRVAQAGPYQEIWGGKHLLFRFPADAVFSLKLLPASEAHLECGNITILGDVEYASAVWKTGRPVIDHPHEPVLNAACVPQLSLLVEMWAAMLESHDRPAVPMEPDEGLEAFHRFGYEEFEALLESLGTNEGLSVCWPAIERVLRQKTEPLAIFPVFPLLTGVGGVTIEDTEARQGGLKGLSVKYDGQVQQDFAVPACTTVFEKPRPDGAIGEIRSNDLRKILGDPDVQQSLAVSVLQKQGAELDGWIFVPSFLIERRELDREYFRVGDGLVAVEGGGAFLPPRTGDIDSGFCPMVQTLPRRDWIARPAAVKTSSKAPQQQREEAMAQA